MAGQFVFPTIDLTSLEICGADDHGCIGDQGNSSDVETNQSTNDSIEIHHEDLDATPDGGAKVDVEDILKEKRTDDDRDDHSS